jgi:hypothetical protein
VNWRFAGKLVVVPALLIAAVLAIAYGAFFIVFGIDWGKLGGAALVAVGFRGVVLVLDLIWERPPQFSRYPWRRPWVREHSFGEEPDLKDLQKRASAQRRSR